MNEVITKRYETWLAEVTDAELAADLAAMKGKEDLIEDAFFRELEFGTGGMRGVLGAGTNRMNIYTVARAAQGLANYVVANFAEKDRSIAISAAVFAANGVHAYIYQQLMPTPCLSFAVRALKCAAGVMVTASHNPSKYNGYKVYGSDGCQITTEAADIILGAIESVDTFRDVKKVTFEQGLEKGQIEWTPDWVYNEFIAAVHGQSMPR